LASLSLTHVHYDANDPISHACAWLALVPQVLCIVYVTLIWSTREAEVLLMFAGQMGCEALNWVLKRVLKEERPRRMNGKGYGMPSSHAQFVSFFSIALTLFLLLRHNPHAPHASSTYIPTKFIERLALSVAALVGALAVAESRIYLNYHTQKQVLVGCAAGAVCAVGWFIVTSIARHYGVIDWLLDLGIAKYCRMRDLVVHEDLVDAGWERWQVRKQKRAGSTGQKKTL